MRRRSHTHMGWIGGGLREGWECKKPILWREKRHTFDSLQEMCKKSSDKCAKGTTFFRFISDRNLNSGNVSVLYLAFSSRCAVLRSEMSLRSRIVGVPQIPPNRPSRSRVVGSIVLHSYSFPKLAVKKVFEQICYCRRNFYIRISTFKN